MIGIHAKQDFADRTLIRPMLELTRSQIEGALHDLGIAWREDHTNQDTSLLRNRLRHQLLPIMREISPEIAQNASNWGRDIASVQLLIDRQVKCLAQQSERAGASWTWTRATLRAQPELLLGDLPAHYITHQCGRFGLDLLTRRVIDAWVRAVKSDSTEPTEHRIGPIVSHVRANRVIFSPAAPGHT